MIILHLINDLDDGGAEAVLHRLVNNDQRNCHKVLSIKDLGKYGPSLVEAGIDVYCLNVKKVWDIRIIKSLYNYLSEIEYNVLQCWMYHSCLIGSILSWILRKRNVFWNIRHTNLERDKNKKSTLFVVRLCAKISKFIPNKIIYCSANAKQEHIDFGFTKTKNFVIHNGYEFDRFYINNKARINLRTKYRIKSEDFVIGMISRVNSQKDHKTLIDTIKIIKEETNINIKCFFIGTGTNKNPFKMNIEKDKLKDEIFLLGPKDNIEDYMNILDVHVLSSFGEAFPNVVAESMACGVPNIVSDVGEARFIVGDLGWVFHPGNIKQLYDRILKSYEQMRDINNWEKLRENGKKRIIENFSIIKMVNEYNNLWKTL